MSEDETKKLLTYIAALWPRFEIVPGLTWKAWHTLMAGIDYTTATVAVAHFAKTSKHPYPPAAPEIFAVIEELRQSPADRITAGEAWEKVVAVGKLAPFRRAGQLPHKAARALERVGGWLVYGMTQTNEIQFLRNRFCEAYAEVTEERRQQALGRNEAAAMLEQVEAKRLNGETKRIESI